MNGKLGVQRRTLLSFAAWLRERRIITKEEEETLVDEYLYELHKEWTNGSPSS